MRRLNTPKKVTHPNDRNFYAKYARVPRSGLPPNIMLRKQYKRRAAPKGSRRRVVRKQRQRGRGIFSSLNKIANNPMVRKLGNTALKKRHKLCTATI